MILTEIRRLVIVIPCFLSHMCVLTTGGAHCFINLWTLKVEEKNSHNDPDLWIFCVKKFYILR